MSQRFQKIYTAGDLEDAHVFQAFMRRNGVACWLVHSNGMTLMEEAASMEDGYKLFVPANQFKDALNLIIETFNYTGDAPITGSLDLAFGGRSRSVPRTQLQYDPVGPEDFIWDPPVASDLIGDAWKTALPKCPQCGHEMTEGDNFCDRCGVSLREKGQSQLRTCNKCGHELPLGSSVCPTCSEVQ